MPRVTKSVTAKSKHKKYLVPLKAIMGLEAGFIKLQNSLISKHFNMPLEIEKREKEILGLYGSLVSMQARTVGVPYSIFINGLAKNEILLNRKVLADIAINDASTFEKIVKTAVN